MAVAIRSVWIDMVQWSRWNLWSRLRIQVPRGNTKGFSSIRLRCFDCWHLDSEPVASWIQVLFNHVQIVYLFIPYVLSTVQLWLPTKPGAVNARALADCGCRWRVWDGFCANMDAMKFLWGPETKGSTKLLYVQCNDMCIYIYIYTYVCTYIYIWHNLLYVYMIYIYMYICVITDDITHMIQQYITYIYIYMLYHIYTYSTTQIWRSNLFFQVFYVDLFPAASGWTGEQHRRVPRGPSENVVPLHPAVNHHYPSIPLKNWDFQWLFGGIHHSRTHTHTHIGHIRHPLHSGLTLVFDIGSGDFPSFIDPNNSHK